MKTTRYTPIHVYATADIKRKLERLAKKNRRSNSAEICAMIEAAYDKEKAHEVQGNDSRPPLL
jgi:predicted transcriptional regulator